MILLPSYRAIQAIALTLCLSMLTHAQELQESDWSFNFSPSQGLVLLEDGMPRAKLGLDAECGASRDAALYASFGLEAQIFNCSKIVFSLVDHQTVTDDSKHWLFRLDFGLIYQDIQKQEIPELIYGPDSLDNDIDGNNRYFDWYKNLGNRVYYLGDSQLIEAYIGYKTPNHTIKAGRIKGIVGLSQSEVFFADDGKFAPYQYWLSRELTSGISYSYTIPLAEFSVAITSGSNPIKGYSYYLDGVIGPNIKGNNTPSLSHNIKFHYANLLADKFSGYIFVSSIKAKIGSTWIVNSNYGKRNNSLDTFGATFGIQFDKQWIKSLKLFAQYTSYLSGLSEDSAQNNGTAIFQDITQSGYYFGATVEILSKLELGVAYEKFDRFDYNTFEYDNFTTLDNPFYLAQQSSKIFHLRYAINPALSFNFGYHSIYNPAPFVSNILDTRGDSKVKITLALKF